MRLKRKWSGTLLDYMKLVISLPMGGDREYYKDGCCVLNVYNVGKQ